ncbi:MAG TPA: TonB family protein [Candidatus Acidoferrales bacterium]
MATAAKQWVGQLVDGKFRLGDFVGSNDRSAVFLTDYEAPGVRKAAIKLVAADGPEAAGLLGRWRHAAELSHPHLIRILASGRCEFNSSPILYVVMEYADENLAVVLARRPLGPAEARNILVPVVDALSYIHSKGFAHTRIKPANILAEEDLLKISSDGLCRIGESSGALGQPGPYDPPEAAGGRISPAGDVWSLGMTLCEALTQRLASWERTNQHEPALPSGLPNEFAEIARHCLRRDPQLRWSIADIAARLNPNAAAAPKQILPSPQSSIDARRYVVPALVAFFLVAVIFVGQRIYMRHLHEPPTEYVIERPELPPSDAPAILPKPKSIPAPVKEPATATPAPVTVKPAATPAPQPAPPAAKLAPQPIPPPTKKAAEPIRSAATQNSSAATAAPVHAASSDPATPSASAGAASGKVLQQVLPNAAQSARDTIHGAVRVTVKVQVDASGQVTNAILDARGPSQFFADRCVQAAQRWKFAPPQANGRPVPSEWLIHFEIEPSTINVHATQTNP